MPLHFPRADEHHKPIYQFISVRYVVYSMTDMIDGKDFQVTHSSFDVTVIAIKYKKSLTGPNLREETSFLRAAVK